MQAYKCIVATFERFYDDLISQFISTSHVIARPGNCVNPVRDERSNTELVACSNTEFVSALNKFFHGPPFCLILPDSIESSIKPRTNKRPYRRRVQSSKRLYTIVTCMGVLSEATTPDRFERQKNGMYWCRVKGSVSYSDERNLTQTSDEAREFHAEASRLQTDRADSGLPQNSQGFMAWASVLVNQPHMDDGRAGSAGVQEQSQSETSTSGNKINVQLLRLIHNIKLLLCTYSKIHNHNGSVLQKR